MSLGQRDVCLIYTPALVDRCEFGRNAKFLLTLTNNKWPPEVGPGGHHFVVLNVSINNTHVFVSAVVTYKTSPTWLTLQDFGVLTEFNYQYQFYL